jgi:hypothetical protein
MRLAATVADVIASEGASRSEAIPNCLEGDCFGPKDGPRSDRLDVLSSRQRRASQRQRLRRQFPPKSILSPSDDGGSLACRAYRIEPDCPFSALLL